MDSRMQKVFMSWMYRGKEVFQPLNTGRIAGHDRQKLLLETLRVLKKGGIFAIHDLMEPARYGDMQAFVRQLREQSYEDVRLMRTTDGSFMGKVEGTLLGLGGSTLLVGRK